MSTTWVVFNDESGIYLENSAGYMATPDEAIEIVSGILNFLESNGQRIEDNNEKQDRYYESLRNRSLKFGKNQTGSRQVKRYLYMFKCGDRYKIGVSRDVNRRLSQLNNRPYPVELYAVSDEPFAAAFEVERKVHEMLDAHKLEGEWFELDEMTASLVACLVEGADDDFDEG